MSLMPIAFKSLSFASTGCRVPLRLPSHEGTPTARKHQEEMDTQVNNTPRGTLIANYVTAEDAEVLLSFKHLTTWPACASKLNHIL